MKTKKQWMWIYEYKDNDTPIGATFYDGWVDDFPHNEGIKLPILAPDWRWEIEIKWEDYND